MFSATSSKRLDIVKSTYQESKKDVAQLVNQNGNDREKYAISAIFAREQVFLNSTNSKKIQAEIDDLEGIRYEILARDPEFLTGMFMHLVEKRTSMNDQIQVKQLIDSGRRLIDQQSWDDLRGVNSRLWSLMPTSVQNSEEMRSFTGII